MGNGCNRIESSTVTKQENRTPVSNLRNNACYRTENQILTEQNKIPISTLCTNAWDSYKWRLKDEKDFDPGWELILDDFHQSELLMTASRFQIIFYNLIENLFLGCKGSMSDDVHKEFVDFVVKETQNILQEENILSQNDICKEIPLYLFKEDSINNRKIQMVFLTVIRISKSTSEEGNVEKEEVTWESYIKLQLSSDKIRPVTERQSTRCREDQQQQPHKIGFDALFDPT